MIAEMFFNRTLPALSCRTKYQFLSALNKKQVVTFTRESFELDEGKSQKLLQIVNNNGCELTRYRISKGRIEKIEAWKAKNGKFKTIDELLQIDGFGAKMLDKFCENVLKHSDNAFTILKLKSPKRRTNAFTIPAVPSALRNQYKSCVSIFITVSSITWARIELNDDGPCRLSDWEFYDITDKRPHLTSLIQHCRLMNRLIPDADCYVLENPQVAQGAAPGSAEQVNINVQKAQLMALLNFALACRTNQTMDETNVFYLKRFLSSRIFNTQVGTERVSTEGVILDLMRTHYNYEDSIESSEDPDTINDNNVELRSNIVIPMELRGSFQTAEKYQRDFLGQALLIGITFIRLCLLRTPTSLAVVSRHFKDDSSV